MNAISFVQAGFLAALGALAIPLIVHLFFRLRSRRVNLGTIRFLRQVLEESARRRRIMRWLLLGLRLAGVALLALIFARPYLLATTGGHVGQLTVLLIDQSATMQQKGESGRLIDQAVAVAKQLISQSPPEGRVEVAFFDHSVYPIGAKHEGDFRSKSDMSSEEILHSLVAPKNLYGATNYSAAMAWARDICAKAPPGVKRLHVLTDLQRSGLDWSIVEPMPADVVTKIHVLGREVANNLSVTDVRPTKLVIRPGEGTQLQVALFNGGLYSVADLPVHLRLENGGSKHNLRDKVKLDPGAVVTLEFQIPALDAGLWRGEVQIETQDELVFDNQRHFAIMVASPYRVLLVDGRPHESTLLSGTYFLDSALRLAEPGETYADSDFQPVVHNYGDGSHLPELDRIDAVVLANVAEIAKSDAQQLADFVSKGHGLLVFTGENVQESGYRDLINAGIGVGAIHGQVSATDLPFRFDSWDEHHPMLAIFNDPQHGDLRRLSFRSITRLEPDKSAHVLASFRGGVPALLEKKHGDGSVLWFNSSCDRQWSDWPRSRLFVPLVHQLIGYQLGLVEGGPIRPILFDEAARAANDVAPGIVPRRGFWQVVNSSPRESETDRCRVEDFAERFALRLDDETAEASVAMMSLAGAPDDLRAGELWHWLAVALVCVLLGEFVMANRTTA